MSVTRSFSEADIARVLTFEELIPAMERALAAFSAGEVIQPVRSVLTLEPGQRYLGVMPAATQEAMGAKLVSFYPKKDRKSTRLNSSHVEISYAVFCLKKKKI